MKRKEQTKAGPDCQLAGSPQHPYLEAGDIGALEPLVHALNKLRSEVHGIRELLIPQVRRYVTVEEAGAIVGRAPFTVRTWIRQGRLKGIRVAGTGRRGRLLISRAELERLIAGNQETSREIL